MDLSTCRDVGFGAGPIPWTAVNAYALRHDLSNQEFSELWEIVKRLDAVYTEARAAKAKIEQGRIGKDKPQSQRRGR